MKGRFWACFLAGALVIAIWALPARAWLRMRYEDVQVVERSELIVVGAIKEGSVILVPHDVPPNRGRSWEYHLVMNQALYLLEVAVNKYIVDGWEPQGGLSIGTSNNSLLYFQALVRKKKAT